MPSAQHRQEIKAEMAKAAAACDRKRYNELVEKLAQEYQLMAEPEWAGSIRFLAVDSERITTEFKNPIAARFSVPIFPSDCAPPAAAVEQPGTGPIQSLFGPATLPALEENPPQQNWRSQDQGAMRWTGLNLGAQVSGFAPTLNWTEMLAATGMITDRNTVLGNPGAGVGVTAAFAAAVATPIGGVIVDPFVSFDYFNHTVEQPLGGSAFLATKSNYQGTAGVKIGPPVGATGWVYGIAGASFLNETLTVANFVSESSSRNTTVPGLTLGIGGAIQVPALSSFGHPVAISVEYEHTLWGTAHFNMPEAWVLSNYAFRRDDDVLMLGFIVFGNLPGP
jgi:hypothetical protein